MAFSLFVGLFVKGCWDILALLKKLNKNKEIIGKGQRKPQLVGLRFEMELFDRSKLIWFSFRK